jgi:hypothetical protein
MREIIQVYRKNSLKPTIFDCIEKVDHLNLQYFSLSKPRSQRFIDQGDTYMIESWNNRKKVLFSGLVSLEGTQNVYFGNWKLSGNSKSLICLILLKDIAEIHYFPNFCPVGKFSQMKYLQNYFQVQRKPMQ